LTIPDEILESTHLSEAELRAELALTLFAQERLTLGQAALVAGCSQLEFQKLLASRRIPIHYGLEELEEDLRRVDSLH
jgi:predicted HTH domain antitoxin